MSLEHAALVERLSRHDRLGTVPRAELEWLAAHGELRSLARGEFLARTGDPRESHHLYVLLSGLIAAYVWRDHVPRKMRGTRAEDLAGVLPFSRMTHSTADIMVEEPVELLQIHSSLFPELIRECPGVTAACVHAMLDRAQAMTEGHLHDEKMFSLGKLAAGLAHELNNPASAALRSVDSLGVRQREMEAASSAMEHHQLTLQQREGLRALRDECLMHARSDSSPFEETEREEVIAEWLEAHGVDPALGEPLADSRMPSERLDGLAAALPGPALGAAITWIAASIDAGALLGEIRESLKRIHDLVTAVKGFTQFDRPLIAGPTHVASGVHDTISVLGPKARARSVTVDVHLPNELPPVRASAAELNQVWASLIDNALDAAPTHSRVRVSARAADQSVVVSVIDQGSGIPEAIRDSVFDPFFTTKPIGQGRGLGLDTARRIVALVEGRIEFDSVPGRTEFRVYLPIDDGGSATRLEPRSEPGGRR